MTQETQEEEILDEIQDQDEKDDEVAPVQYDISTYGADYPVDGLVKRLQKGDILFLTFKEIMFGIKRKHLGLSNLCY